MQHIVPQRRRNGDESRRKATKPRIHVMDEEDLREASLADCIAEAFIRSRYTQAYLAKKLGVSAGQMSKLISGQAALHGEVLIAFCKETRSLAPWQWYSQRISETLGFDGELPAAVRPQLQ